MSPISQRHLLGPLQIAAMFAIAHVGVPCAPRAIAENPENTVAARDTLKLAYQHISDGQLNKAATLLQQVADQDGSDTAAITQPRIMLHMQLAAAHQRRAATKEHASDHPADGDAAMDHAELAAEHYRSVLDLVEAPSGRQPAGRETLIRLTAADHLVKQSDPDSLVRCVIRIVTTELDASADQRSQATSYLLRAAYQFLDAGDFDQARSAYQIVAQHGREAHAGNASLGLAWITLSDGSDAQQAAIALDKFLTDYPQHRDASYAAGQAVACWLRAGKIDAAEQSFAKICDLHPQDPRTWEASATLSQDQIKATRARSETTTNDHLKNVVGSWLAKRSRDSLDRFSSANQTALAIVALVTQDPQSFDQTILSRHAALDHDGDLTHWLLGHLDSKEATSAPQSASAQRLARLVVADLDVQMERPAAHAAAFRWLGKRQNWSIISLATAKISIDDLPAAAATSDAWRSIATLIAESAMQSHHPQDALPWWNHLVDQCGADDFPTSLRCAEAAVAVGQIEAAKRRLLQARQAAGGDVGNQALLEMITADLAIRNIEFHRARQSLESVIRNPEAASQVKARAQWMIGETHYLQEKYELAIAAYRKVEGIDDSPQWVAAALIQAGKSFEKLGRTREATICYGSLIQRFSGSPHVDVARQRIATLPGTTGEKPGNGGMDTLRR